MLFLSIGRKNRIFSWAGNIEQNARACAYFCQHTPRHPARVLSGWAHAGPKWVGPRGAQVGGPTWGPRGWAHVGPSQKFGTPKNPKIKNSQNQNPFCPKCRQGFLCRKKASPPHLGPSRPFFCVGRKNPKIAQILPIFLGGPMGPIHPVWALAAIHPRWGNRYC